MIKSLAGLLQLKSCKNYKPDKEHTMSIHNYFTIDDHMPDDHRLRGHVLFGSSNTINSQYADPD